MMVHNFYRSDVPSGENKTVSEMASQLDGAGVEIVPFFRRSDDIEQMSHAGRAALALGPMHAPGAVSAFRAVLRARRPDVVQIHNVFPMISPGVIPAARAHGIPVLQFVHNYRYACLAGTMMRDDKPCTRCIVSNSRLPAVRYSCYRGSRLQTGLMALGFPFQKRAWSQVSRFVAISAFVRDMLERSGIGRSRISLRLNTVPDPGEPRAQSESRFLFVGRLSTEKGVRLLLEAWQYADLPDSSMLEIAGTGPLTADVAEAARVIRGIRYLGPLGSEGLDAAYRRAGVVVVPALWHEPFGRTAVEALAHGRPVIATRFGGLQEIVDTEVGWLTGPDARGLSVALRSAATAVEMRVERGAAARRRYLERYTTGRGLEDLLGIYNEIVSATGGERKGR